MERDEEPQDGLFDLGTASGETKGMSPMTNEFQGTLPTGLLAE